MGAALRSFVNSHDWDREHASSQGPGLAQANQHPTLIAYKIAEQPYMPLVAAPSSRAWMEDTSKRFANRCLPLLIANQSGWFVLNSHEFRATWNGRNENSGVRIEYMKGLRPHPASCHFGHGIITWTLPYFFRTSPGYNLLVRGPANMFKAGVCPLEGIVDQTISRIGGHHCFVGPGAERVFGPVSRSARY